ncbi:hypothetical protein V6N11_055871 [Hibiscus sabdariffa]|uniref:Uncharacterized protein n=1 Tax=Hibiscus sabdariffa TaxID=183260 RepID=A0ABR2T254_9ROSI
MSWQLATSLPTMPRQPDASLPSTLDDYIATQVPLVDPPQQDVSPDLPHQNVSPDLSQHHPLRKFEHALKHGSRNSLFVVTLGWFMDSVKRNVRLSESLYVVKGFGEHKQHVDELNRLVKSPASESSCLPSGFHEAKKLDMIEKPNIQFSERVPNKSMDSMLSGHTVYIESDISDELWNKVLETASKEGAIMVDRWFVGCGASLVACEVSSILRYIGHSNNIVTIGTLLENSQNQIVREVLKT